ncbi:MAG: hypothetical protein AAB405_01390 [Patescibacteria group bacterium]
MQSYRQRQMKPFPEWKKLEERLLNKYDSEPAYYFLNLRDIDWAMETISIDSGFDNKYFRKIFLDNILKLEKIYKEIIKSPEFRRLYKETFQYLKFIKKQWRKNKKEVFKIINDLSGVKLPQKQITVCITHPKLKNGRMIPNKNIILWGHSEDWKNYSTVYLCHELMHIATENKFKNLELGHAIIELLTDNELRIRLNKKGNYFYEDKKEIGHKYLKLLEKKILKYWKEYLDKKNGKNIFEFEALLLRKKLLQ